MAKFLINCKYCGALLLKTSQPLVAILESEIKCPNPKCGRIVQLPGEVNVILEGPKEKVDNLIV
jgi:phage FluMu protein Com